MDGGAFQNLCDAYLSYKGYKNVYSLGMHTGTDKTAKGNPDTYFLTAENKYVFVMYTTQKTDFVKKAIEDIDKCFDSQKTGVSAEDIVEIIYCHTYGRLGAGEDQYLRRYCEKRGAILTLIGLDQLGNDIFREYPILAHDFLESALTQVKFCQWTCLWQSMMQTECPLRWEQNSFFEKRSWKKQKLLYMIKISC